jgi:hypothetical protein
MGKATEMSYSPFVISTLALLFTVFSFWWMNWRTGKLRVGAPRTYAAIGSLSDTMVLEFPFVFFNDGPMPIIVQNLRLIFSDETEPRPLDFIATVRRLGTDEDRSFATQFPVRGREAMLMICEFQRKPGGMDFEARSYPMELQAKLGNNKPWKCICCFSLNVSTQGSQTIKKAFVVHDNALLPSD